MVIRRKEYTVEEFEKFIALPENADRRFELIHGEIVEKMPTEEHGLIVMNVAIPLGNHVRANKLGRLTVEVRYRKQGDKHNDHIPDLSFTSAARALPLVKKGAVPQMPDFVLEVQSPDDSEDSLRNKAKYYLQNGSRLVWLAFPKGQSVEVCTIGEAGEIVAQTFHADDILDGGAVLPGFKIPVRDVFAE